MLIEETLKGKHTKDHGLFPNIFQISTSYGEEGYSPSIIDFTTNTYPVVTDMAVTVIFSAGFLKLLSKSDTYYVWPVRGGM